MPRTPNQSDFVVELPKVQVVTNEAGPVATRWVMRLTWFMLAILVLLCVIGPHIPSGE